MWRTGSSGIIEFSPTTFKDERKRKTWKRPAQVLLDREGKALKVFQEEIRRLSIPLVTCFQDRATLLSRFDLPAFPPCFAEPSDGPHPDLSQAIRNAENLRLIATPDTTTGSMSLSQGILRSSNGQTPPFAKSTTGLFQKAASRGGGRNDESFGCLGKGTGNPIAVSPHPDST